MTEEIATLEPAASDPGSSVLEPLRRRLVRRIEKLGGRHDERAIYGGQPGDLGLTGGPSSVSWELNGDLASLAISGVGAVLMEVLHPSVMAGVFTQSSYRTEPLRRSRNTLGYVVRTTFGNTAAATQVIENVRRIHGRVHGVRPDGVAYSALDPELLAWVHTCIPWAIMTAYDRYARPLSTDEKNRYLREQAVIGRMAGADWVPETVAELEAYVETMRPHMQVNDQTRSFIAFLSGRGPEIPTGRLERFDRFVSLHSSMSLMPEWARELTGTNAPAFVRHSVLHARNHARARLVRWAYPELPCKRLALARATTHAV
jgi:uncharacterized protein (DUF2236 family)